MDPQPAQVTNQPFASVFPVPQGNTNVQAIPPVSAPQQSITPDPLSHLQHEIEELEKKTHVQEQQAFQTMPPPAPDPFNPIDPAIINSMANPLPQNIPIPQPDDSGLVPPLPQPTASRDKERKDQLIGSPSPEMVPMREVGMEYEAPPEVAPWVEVKADPKTITLPTPIQDEYGEILLRATHTPKPKITLPLDEEELEKAFHHKVFDSVRWLAEWCKRVVLVNPGRVFYRE